MAERNQQKIADNHGIADDDPFAELTRIMGFDPREPARPQAVEPHFGEASADVHDDFDIDLEKELMGEFSVEEEPVQAAPEGGYEPASGALDEPAPQIDENDAVFEETAAFEDMGAFEDRGAFEDMDDAVAASLEQDFALDDEVAAEATVDAPEPVADPLEQFARSYAARGETPEQTDTSETIADPVQEPWFEPVADDAVDNEFSTADEAETLATPTAAEDHSDFDAAASADLDDASFAPAEDAAALYEEPARHEEPARLKEPETNQAAVDHEAEAFEDADPYQPFDHSQPAAAAYQPATHDPAASDDFEASFDSAMADVDMDFADTPQPEPVASNASEAGEAVDEDVSTAQADINSAFDKAFATEAYAQPVALEPREPAVAAPRENTLEDELNALLNKMTARSPVSAVSAWPLTTPVARQEQSPAAPQIAQTAQPAADEATVGETAMDEDDLEATLVADLHAMEFDDEAHTASDVDFDTEAFHAALTEADDDEAVSADSDPLDALNRFTPTPSTVQAAAAAMSNTDRGVQARPEAPDVETIDVPERVAALADDLDIPDVPFEEPGEGNALFDDLENEFAGLLGQMNATPAQTHAAYDDGFRRGSGQPQAASAAFAQPAAYSSSASFHPVSAGMDGGDSAGGAPFAQNDPFAVDDPAYDPDEAVAVSDMGETDDERRPRRSLLVAGIVCAVAVIGGLGALAMSFGDNGAGDAPALVKADNSPIKVKPKNPGGTVIPNQDNKVYDAVAKGIQPASPTQQKLVTNNDDPVDVAAAAPQSRVVDLSGSSDTDAQDGAPMAKSEDRVEQTAGNADEAAPDAPVVTPHKVRTMVVKPDGSLVPREDPAPVVAATEPADPAPQHVISDDQTGAVPPSQSGESALKPANTTGQAASTPSTAPIAPQRPSDQPVDVVGEVKPDQVASVDTTASTAPAGAWSMQIASQPTAESAQSTYKDLSRRYASILDGHSVNIVKADIAGKGTFYRVRVPAQTRNEAINLCESYKAAGGNCFVSK